MRVAALYGLIGASVTLTSFASAQTGLTERLRLQGIYANQTGQSPPDDLAGQVVPELSFLALGERSLLRVTYTFAATGHTALPADIANRLNLSSAFELSKRTTMLLSAEAGHSTVSNALIARSPSDAPAGVLPLTTGQLVSTRVSEGTSWEASPVVRLTQQVDGAYVTSIDDPVALDGYIVNAIVSVDRSWKNDAVGIDARASYGRSHTDPLPPERLIPLGLTPHWRHDISRALTSFFAAGATVVLSPDAGTRPHVGPFAQASFDYLVDDSTFDLTASVGTQPNALTAQLLYAEQATFRAATPLSVKHAIVASAAVGFTHGSVVDLRRVGVQAPDFNAFIGDAGIGWSPTTAVELFARYQFLDQVTDATAGASTPSLQRHAVLVGVQLTSRPDPVRVPTRFPQRVDRSDAPGPAAPASAPAESGSDSGSAPAPGAPVEP